MKTNTKVLTWLTQSMSDKGFTPQVADYLLGRKKLPNDIGWFEFFLLWFNHKEKFKDTNLFKKMTTPFVNMKKGKKGENAMMRICGIIDEIPHSRSFFLNIIPVFYAIRLCRGFWDFSNIWDRASNKFEKQLILTSIRQSIATINFEDGELKRYYNMTKDFASERIVVDVLISSFIKSTPRKVPYLYSSIPLSENQITAFCNEVKIEKEGYFNPTDIFKMYYKTKNSQIMNLLFDMLGKRSDKYHLDYILDEIKRLIRNCKEGEEEELKELLFPVSYFILDNKGNLRGNITDIRNILPAYKDDNRINRILEIVIKYYTNYEYKMLHDAFVFWYRYAPKEIFIDLFKESISLHGHDVFTGAKSVFELCKDETVVDTVISIRLPMVEEVDDDLADFMDWLKAGGTPWYPRIKETVIEADYISKWWNKVRITDDRQMGYFLRLVKHFD